MKYCVTEDGKDIRKSNWIQRKLKAMKTVDHFGKMLGCLGVMAYQTLYVI